jgi:carbon storage regulator CsrA
MLVLSATAGERILVGDVWVKVVEVRGGKVRGGKVRLGFEAPDHVPVNREEIAIRKGLVPEEAVA